jgi:DNA-binding response OmpR family regulator
VAPLVRLMDPEIVVAASTHNFGEAYRVLSGIRAAGYTRAIVLLREMTGGLIPDAATGGITEVSNESELRLAASLHLGTPADLTNTVSDAMALLHLPHATIDLARGDVLRDGRRIRLAPKERELLTALARAEGRIISREELLATVWKEPVPASRVVDRQILRLRRHVERDPVRPVHIVTVFGEGYRFVA